jgi:hypothetical protein
MVFADSFPVRALFYRLCHLVESLFVMAKGYVLPVYALLYEQSTRLASGHDHDVGIACWVP